MKKYIQPTIEVKEVEFESNICAASVGDISMDSEPTDGPNYAASTPSFSIWGADEEE